MASFSTISIRFNADLKQFSSQMQNAQRSMQKYGKQMQSVGQNLTLGITLPVIGLGAAAVNAASDAEETAGKFSVVFRDIAEAAQNSADTLRNSYGLSSAASQQLLADTGDLLTGFGFTQEMALDLSTQVNKLAVDLASFTNFSGGAEGASAALTKALLGERESVKSLGIAILEADVKARVLLNTQNGLTFETERQARAYATLQIAQEQSKNALGDYARTSESFANQSRLLTARLQDVAVQFGEIILPYVVKLTGALSKLVDWFSELDKSSKEIIVVVAALAAALGPLLVTFGFMMTTVIPGLVTAFSYLSATVIPAVTTAFKGLNITMLANPIGIVVAAVATLAYGFTELIETVTPAVSKLTTLFNLLKSGGNYFSFVNLQIASQAKAMAKLAEAAKDAKDQMGSWWDSENNLLIDPNPKAPEFTPPVIPDGSGPTPQVSGIDAFLEPKPIQTSPFDIIAPKMQQQVEAMNASQLLMLENSIIFNERFTEIIQNTAANFAVGFGQMIASMASGTFSMQDIGKLLLGTLGDMAIQVGKMAIGIGVAVKGIKAALQSLNPIVAIAAGVALVALGSLAKSALGKIGSGGGAEIPAFADGGLVYGPTLGLMGEYSGANNNPEVIAPLDKLKDMISDTVGNSNGAYIAETKLRGQDLLISLQRTQNSNKRRS